MLDGDLLAWEEEERRIESEGLCRRGPARQLHHHREAALHVARAEPVHRAAVDPARQVVVRRDGVEVAREDDERPLDRRTPEEQRQIVVVDEVQRDRGTDELRQALLVPALGRDVDELERSRGEVEGHSGILHGPGHNPSRDAATTRSATRRRGRARLRRGGVPARRGRGRGARRAARARPDRGCRDDRRADPAPGPARLSNLCGEREARRAEACVQGVGGGSAPRRRRARSDSAASPRECARLARRRPHAADPRHLRPARRHGRGKAPGRARAAGVQPAAHAGHVAAPRAARRRRRHQGPGRVAARDRPTPRARPRDAAPPPARRPDASSARLDAASASARTPRPSRWPATRTSASRRS